MTQSFIPPAKPIIGEEERAAVDRVLRSGMIAQGPEVAAFETEFSDHFKLGRACVAVNSGTSGLHLGLLSCGIGAGDEVIDLLHCCGAPGWAAQADDGAHRLEDLLHARAWSSADWRLVRYASVV